jgi:Asp-tRNA(Asn)/Glu-tRNA(Gln) amidotransferase B subunit
LLAVLGEYGSIIVWNQAFENTRLREIALDFPEYAARIDSLFQRVADLMVPFRRKHFYTPDMNGSYSLKAVLPALIPDLSYASLEIQEGVTASMTYESLYYDEDPGSLQVKRENLLEYCKMDTLSMVRIQEMLIA